MPEAIKTESSPAPVVVPASSGDNGKTTPPVDTTKVDVTPPADKGTKVEGADDKAPAFTDFLSARTGAKVVPPAPKDDKGGTKLDVKEKQSLADRDFTGIDDADVDLFRNMSRPSFEKLVPIYKEYKTLKQTVADNAKVLAEKDKALAEAKKTGLPESYYQHPRAFTLTDEYQQLEQTEQIANQIVQFWQEQLINIKSNKEWQDLDADGKGGFIIGKPQPASPQAEVQVMAHLQHSIIQANRKSTEKEQYGSSFSSKVKDDLAVLNEAAQKFFPGYEKDDHPTHKIQQEIIEMIPKSVSAGNPLVPLFGMVSANNVVLQNMVNQLNEEIKKLKGTLETAGRVTPTAGQIPGGGKTNDNKIPSIADYKKRMNDGMVTVD